MSENHLARARLLLAQQRFELAERELQQALVSSPNDADAHALLGLCLSHREAWQDATSAAEQAIHLAPDEPFPHYVRAAILNQRQRYPEAEASVREAIALDPFDAPMFAMLSQICFNQRRWQDALTAAEQGLAIDAESADCTNLRAMALVKLGRKMQASEAIQTALERNPEDADTHANMGWTRVEQGRYDEALHHFREALRLEPDSDWARRGIIEALKARNPIYRVMLNYFLWMNKLSHKYQWTILIGLYVLYRFLGYMADQNPALAPWINPLLIVYVAFAIMTWISVPLFNLLLRLNRFGRLALNREETITANWVGILLAVALGCLAWYFIADNEAALVTALAAGLTIPSVSCIYRCQKGWPRIAMLCVTLALAVWGFTTAGLLHLGLYLEGKPGDLAIGLGLLGLRGFVFAALGSQFLANFLMQATVRK